LVKSLCHPDDYHEILVRVCQTRLRWWITIAKIRPTCYSPDGRVAHLRIRIAIAFESMYFQLTLILMAMSSLRELYGLS
jgi:hypothetical protein